MNPFRFHWVSSVRTSAHVMLGLTLARLILVAPLVLAISAGPRRLGLIVALLGTVILADIYDGRLARRWSVDNISRRIVDPVVDRITMHSAILAASIATHQFLILCLAFVLRDAVQGYISLRCIRRGVVLVGDNLHKVYCLGGAVLLVGLCWGGTVATALVATFATMSLTVLYDYMRSAASVPTASTAALRVVRVRRFEELGLGSETEFATAPPLRQPVFAR